MCLDSIYIHGLSLSTLMCAMLDRTQTVVELVESSSKGLQEQHKAPLGHQTISSHTCLGACNIISTIYGRVYSIHSLSEHMHTHTYTHTHTHTNLYVARLDIHTRTCTRTHTWAEARAEDLEEGVRETRGETFSIRFSTCFLNCFSSCFRINSCVHVRVHVTSPPPRYVCVPASSHDGMSCVCVSYVCV